MGRVRHEQILRIVPARDAYHWATHQGAEVDLLAFVSGRRIGFEIKRTDRPALTRSMVTARDDLELDELWVVFPGRTSVSLAEKIRTLPLEQARRLLG